MVCTSFQGRYSMNGMMAKPVSAEKLDGQLLANDGTKLLVYRLRAPEGYCALGDIVTQTELTDE